MMMMMMMMKDQISSLFSSLFFPEPSTPEEAERLLEDFI